MSANRKFTQDSVEATGGEIHVELGFKPSIVQIATTTGDSALWMQTMPDGSGGIRPFPGTSGKEPDGFTIDPDGVGINTAGNTIHFVATGDD